MFQTTPPELVQAEYAILALALERLLGMILGFYIIIAILYFAKAPAWIAYILLGLGLLFWSYVFHASYVMSKGKMSARQVMVLVFPIILNLLLIAAFYHRGNGKSKNKKKAKK